MTAHCRNINKLLHKEGHFLLQNVHYVSIYGCKFSTAVAALHSCGSLPVVGCCDCHGLHPAGCEWLETFVPAQWRKKHTHPPGAYNGLQALVKQAGPYKPIYVHCWAHILNLVLQDVSKWTALCARTFDLLQKNYVVVEGSAKRHSEYLKACESMHLDNGLLALQSLSRTRWSAKAVNLRLRIVKRCTPAMCACLAEMSEMSDSEADGLLKTIKDPSFVFGVEFLRRLFTMVNESWCWYHLAGWLSFVFEKNISELLIDNTMKTNCFYLNVFKCKLTLFR